MLIQPDMYYRYASKQKSFQIDCYFRLKVSYRNCNDQLHDGSYPEFHRTDFHVIALRTQLCPCSVKYHHFTSARDCIRTTSQSSSKAKNFQQ